MLKIRREAAQDVADRLIAAENAIDQAIICTADLSASLPKARAHAHLAAEVGQSALEQASSSFASLVKARGEIIATHRELATTKIDIGLREVALGGLMDKPLYGVEEQGLRVVAKIAA